MPALPIHLDEALHLFTRASPALRRYVANVPAAANGPLFADPAAMRHATVVESVETASTFSDPDAPPAKAVQSYLYTPMVRSVPSRAGCAAGDASVGAHEWLEPVSFDIDCEEAADPAASETVLAHADPPTRPEDPWTPPARRPGEPLRGHDAAVELSPALSFGHLPSPASLCRGTCFDDFPVSALKLSREKNLIFGGVVAILVADENCKSRLLSGRSLTEPKTGDTLGIIRHDAETVSIMSIRITGMFQRANNIRQLSLNDESPAYESRH
jgi:hypothetical protein